MSPIETAGLWLRVLVAGWIETTEQFQGGADLGQNDGRAGAVGGEQRIEGDGEIMCPAQHNPGCGKEYLGVEAGADARTECGLDESLGVQVNE